MQKHHKIVFEQFAFENNSHTPKILFVGECADKCVDGEQGGLYLTNRSRDIDSKELHCRILGRFQAQRPTPAGCPEVPVRGEGAGRPRRGQQHRASLARAARPFTPRISCSRRTPEALPAGTARGTFLCKTRSTVQRLGLRIGVPSVKSEGWQASRFCHEG